MSLKFFNESKTHFIEIKPNLDLFYIYESKGNKLLEVYSIKELENYLEGLKND